MYYTDCSINHEYVPYFLLNSRGVVNGQIEQENEEGLAMHLDGESELPSSIREPHATHEHKPNIAPYSFLVRSYVDQYSKAPSGMRKPSRFSDLIMYNPTAFRYKPLRKNDMRVDLNRTK